MITREHEQTERYIAELESELTRLKADVTGFAEWIQEEGRELRPHGWIKKWGKFELMTTSELYQEYLKQKQ